MQSYSSRAYRSFKAFVGELTAASAGIFVAIQEATPVIEGLGQKDSWGAAAKVHCITVNSLTSEQVACTSLRLNVVSLYSGFDLYLADLRSGFHRLHGREWVQYDRDSPFDAIARNSRFSEAQLRENLGSHRIDTVDHYRLVRNAIAHPRANALEISQKFSIEHSTSLSKARSEYGMQTAPNVIDHLSFHDIKLFARVALDLTQAIDSIFDPGDRRLNQLLAERRADPTKAPRRIRNSSIGWLKTEFGVTAERAERIVSMSTHELDG